MTLDDLPFIDAHDVVVALDAPAAHARLRDAIARSPMLGVRGFPLREDAATRIRLAGKHLFAAYDLVFDLERAGDTDTRVRATTHARFRPGLGRLYRALVIGSGIHAWIVRRFLRRLAAS